MNQKVSFPNVDLRVREYFSEESAESIPLITLGPGSYLVDAQLEYGSLDGHVLIGRYSSLAHRLKFIIGANHNIQEVANYPFYDLRHRGEDGTINHSFGANHYQIIIGNDVWMGCDVTVLGGVRIGNGAVIGAGSLLTKDVPPYAVVAGNPARIVKYRFSEEIIEGLQEIKWWNWPEEKIEAHLEDMKDPEGFVNKFRSAGTSLGDGQLAEQMEALRQSGNRLYAVIGDFSAERPVWKRVLVQFLQTFRQGDQRLLLMAASSREAYRAHMGKARAVLDAIGGPGADHVALLDDVSAVLPEFVRGADAVLTTREDISSQCVDYASGRDVEILSGLEYDVFQAGYRGQFHPVLRTNREFTTEEKQAFVEKDIEDKKAAIGELVNRGEYGHALQQIGFLAGILYRYNQRYTDDLLEGFLQDIERAVGGGLERSYRPEKNTLLFYDGFGFDNRGLVQIYLKALCRLGYHVVYITGASARGKIPSLERILSSGSAEILFLSQGQILEQYRELCGRILEKRPAAGFLYTVPDDVAGVMAFAHFSGAMRRFLIDLTDHSFWLGIRAMDCCLEYRDYGASISLHFRGIPREKIAVVPCYPVIEKELGFQGYPFPKEAGDFVIFSGGALYKTMDPEHTYYRMVAHCLEHHPGVKFWYAGSGDDTQLKKLMEEYPGRVFHTPERRDLFALLQHVDMYLNTYPIGGGLMMQYSAAAGRAPLTLCRDNEGSGMLLGQERLGIEFYDPEEFRAALSRFIDDPKYRLSLEKDISKSVSNAKVFTNRLKNFLRSRHGDTGKLEPVDTGAFRRGCLERFLETVKFEG